MRYYIYLLMVLLVSCNDSADKDGSGELDKEDTTLAVISIERPALPYAPETYVESPMVSVEALVEEKNEILEKIKDTKSDTVPVFGEKEKELGELSRLYMLYEDKIAKIKFETICGGVDDCQPVENYDGTLGVTREFVQALSNPVGQIQWRYSFGPGFSEPGATPGNVQGVRWCTGALISENLFITAGHCFDREGNGWKLPKRNGEVISSKEIATLMRVNFNYQVNRTTGQVRNDTIDYPVEELMEYRQGNLDYAIIRLGRDRQGKFPGERFGRIAISKEEVAIGNVVGVIQHPLGKPKVIEAGPVTFKNVHLLSYNDIDTQGGSSGSPVISISSDGIVAVHVSGGCDVSRSGHNNATAIRAILPYSRIIRQLTGTP